MAQGSGGEVAAGQWMVSDRGQKLGPYTLDQMKQMIREGRMPPGALVWAPGMPEWKPWQQTPQFELMGGGGGWSGPALRGSQNQIVDYLVFRRMILPLMIQIIFWLGLFVLMISCIVTWWLDGKTVPGLFTYGFGFILFGLLWRCWCEMMILFYRINETLADIKGVLEKREK